MIEIVLTLIFSVVMLVFMAFPAMKIVEWLSERIELTQERQNFLIIATTIFLSLMIGLFLQFY